MMRTRLCENCTKVYSGQCSCPACGHIPRTERKDYAPPEPCDPWRVRLDFPEASLDMTVTHEGQRKLVHRIIRLFGSGSTYTDGDAHE